MGQRINCVIMTNPRLAFMDSETKVKNFMKMRLGYFGVQEICFCEEQDVSNTIERMCDAGAVTAVLSIMNPLTDTAILSEAADVMIRNRFCSIRVDGAIPGTQFEYLLAPGEMKSDVGRSGVFRVTSQQRYNNQFNLYKYKRLKQFFVLLDNVPELPDLSIDELADRLAEDNLFMMMARYGSDVAQKEYQVCPHCGGDLQSLSMTMSQPFCGYIPVNRPLYHECIKCGLIVMSPFIEGDESYKMYDEFDTQDFQVSLNNPYRLGTARCDLIERYAMQMPLDSRTLDLGGVLEDLAVF